MLLCKQNLLAPHHRLIVVLALFCLIHCFSFFLLVLAFLLVHLSHCGDGHRELIFLVCVDCHHATQADCWYYILHHFFTCIFLPCPINIIMQTNAFTPQQPHRLIVVFFCLSHCFDFFLVLGFLLLSWAAVATAIMLAAQWANLVCCIAAWPPPCHTNWLFLFCVIFYMHFCASPNGMHSCHVTLYAWAIVDAFFLL